MGGTTNESNVQESGEEVKVNRRKSPVLEKSTFNRMRRLESGTGGNTFREAAVEKQLKGVFQPSRDDKVRTGLNSLARERKKQGDWLVKALNLGCRCVWEKRLGCTMGSLMFMKKRKKKKAENVGQAPIWPQGGGGLGEKFESSGKKGKSRGDLKRETS